MFIFDFFDGHGEMLMSASSRDHLPNLSIVRSVCILLFARFCFPCCVKSTIVMLAIRCLHFPSIMLPE